jgi:hypothetical protein
MVYGQLQAASDGTDVALQGEQIENAHDHREDFLSGNSLQTQYTVAVQP